MAETASTELSYHGRPLPITEKAHGRFSQASIDLITESVAKGADFPTLGRFLEISARYDLDPYAGEIWCANMSGRDGSGGRMAILVGRDGYLKVARRDPDFIDVDADVVYEKDDFKVVRAADGNRTVEHSYGNPATRGDAQGAYAVLRRKGKPDRYFYAPLDQYAKDAEKSAWRYRDAMAIKCAVSYIARTTYGVSGPVPIDELAGGLQIPGDSPEHRAVVEGTATMTMRLPEEVAELFDRAHDLDPKSWRRNEVEARVFDAAGEPLPDEVRKVRADLEAWLATNEPTDAEVVEDEDAGESAEPPPVEPGEAAEASPADAPDEDLEGKLAAAQARGKDLMHRLSGVADGTREAEELDAELEKVTGEVRELERRIAGQDTLDV